MNCTLLILGSLLLSQEQQPKAVLEGHSVFGIFGVAYSADGKLIASAGGGDGTIKLWDAKSLRPIATLKSHLDMNIDGGFLFAPVRGIAFVTDKNVLASISIDEQIILWDTKSYQKASSISANSPLWRIVSVPKQSLFITTNGKSGATLWDATSKKRLGEIGSLDDNMHTIAVNADGNMLAAGNLDTGLTVWRIKERKKLMSLDGHKDRVTSITFSSDGKLMASGDYDGKVFVWDLATGSSKHSINGDTRMIKSLAFVSNDKCLAWAAVGNEKLIIWDLLENKQRTSVSDKNILGLTIAPDGHSILTWGSRSTIHVWSKVLD